MGRAGGSGSLSPKQVWEFRDTAVMFLLGTLRRILQSRKGGRVVSTTRHVGIFRLRFLVFGIWDGG